MKDPSYEKVFFRLKQDEDGYPPDEWESLWAAEIEQGRYRIANIPFYVREVSNQDVVEAEIENGLLVFTHVIEPSTHSVIRIVVFDESFVSEIRTQLNALGCDTEVSHIPNLISVDVPPTVELDRVIAFLDSQEDSESIEYETASIRR